MRKSGWFPVTVVAFVLAMAPPAQSQDMPDAATRERVADWLDQCNARLGNLKAYAGELGIYADVSMRELVTALELRLSEERDPPVAEAIREFVETCLPIAERLRVRGLPCGMLAKSIVRTGNLTGDVTRNPERYLDPDGGLDEFQRWTVEEYLLMCVPAYAEALNIYAPLLAEAATATSAADVSSGAETASETTATVVAEQAGDTGSGTGQADWLLSGTLASAAASEEALASPFIGAEHTVQTNIYITGEGGASTQWVPYDGDGVVQWGTWNDAGLSSHIPKYQHVLRHTDGSGHIDRHVVGVLEEGIFVVAHDSWPEEAQYGGYFAFSLVNYDHEFLQIHGPGTYQSDRTDVFHAGATWKGEALGVDRSSREIVYGSAVLMVTDFVPGDALTPSGNEAGNFSYRFEVDWNNGDREQFSFTHTHLEYEEAPYDDDEPHENAPRRALYGAFLGLDVEEILGVFRTPGYHGSFGLIRQ